MLMLPATMYGALAMTGAGPLMASAYSNPYYYGGGFNRFRYGYGPNYGLGGMYGGMGYGGAAWMNPYYMSGSYW